MFFSSWARRPICHICYRFGRGAANWTRLPLGHVAVGGRPEISRSRDPIPKGGLHAGASPTLGAAPGGPASGQKRRPALAIRASGGKPLSTVASHRGLRSRTVASTAHINGAGVPWSASCRVHATGTQPCMTLSAWFPVQIGPCHGPVSSAPLLHSVLNGQRTHMERVAVLQLSLRTQIVALNL